MRKLFLAVILLVLVSGLAYSQPRLEVSVSNFDFGDAPRKGTLVHHFWFKSVGTDTVRIHDIKTGCDCAVTSLERNWIAPSDSMKIALYWDISKYRGEIVRTPRVFTNASPDPLRLQLSANALLSPDSIRPVTVKPYIFELAKSSRMVIDSMSFLIVNHSDRDLAVSLVSPPVEECDLVLPDSIGALAGSTGYITVKPEFTDTEFKTSITLLISDGNDRNDKRITIPIRRKFYGVKEK